MMNVKLGARRSRSSNLNENLIVMTATTKKKNTKKILMEAHLST